MIALGKAPERLIQVASADQVSQAAVGMIDPSSPAEALRAEARREMGIGRNPVQVAPAALVASIAPIHKTRSRYWVTAQ
jgi:hypothetical protein